MKITVNSKNDPEYEKIFDDLIRDVFGFSFAPWLAKKIWDERYESYSVIRDGRALSNLCIFKTDMLIGGLKVTANQFGAVATRKSERNKGLSSLLMNHVLALYPDTPAFLYANPGVIGFYGRFGFSRTAMYRPETAAVINNPVGGAVKCSPEDILLLEALDNRRVFSGIVDDVNTQPVKIFHLLLDYPDDIYYLPRCGAAVVAKQEGGRLFLADVLTRESPTFEDLKKELPFNGVNRVEFGFCPDWLGVEPDWTDIDSNSEPFFIRGGWRLPGKFRFPVLSAT